MTVELDDEQRIEVRIAREALDRSLSGTDYAASCGALEFHVRELLGVIAALTGTRTEA